MTRIAKSSDIAASGSHSVKRAVDAFVKLPREKRISIVKAAGVKTEKISPTLSNGRSTARGRKSSAD